MRVGFILLRCKYIVLSLSWLVLFNCNNDGAVVIADVVLDKKTMALAFTSAELSALAYEMNPPSDGYDMLKSFTDEPDQALVAKKNGYCYGVFRGTTLTIDDWSQNLVLQSADICGSDRSENTVPAGGGGSDTTTEEPAVCCTVRAGYYDAYHTNYYQDFEKALRHCAMDCIDQDECVILTGHSQGGAVASVAAITMADLNPYVFTFGQPPTLAPGCPFISSERWYRWVNTKPSEHMGITYDPVPFSPGFGTECWGHFLVLGEDTGGVAYLGLDDHTSLHPIDPQVIAHTMIGVNGTDTMGYVDRISALIQYSANASIIKLETAAEKVKERASGIPVIESQNTKKKVSRPVPADGFETGSLCSVDTECLTGMCKRETGLSWKRCRGVECAADSECSSDRCDNGECATKLGSCQPCDEDSDCKSDKCLAFQCAGPGQLMDENCGCYTNGQCRSGRCDGVNPRICEALVPMDARCNEGADCLSGYCSWNYRCADPSQTHAETKIRNRLLSWRTAVAVAALVVLCCAGKYALGWFFDSRYEYESIPNNDSL